MTTEITFKTCGVCGKTVKQFDDSTTVSLESSTPEKQIKQEYHYDCYYSHTDTQESQS